MPRARASTLDTQKLTKDILGLIRDERHREVLTRHLGLFSSKETLQDVGLRFGITRQRAEQIKRNGLSELKTAVARGESLLQLQAVEQQLLAALQSGGQVARVSDVAAELGLEDGPEELARITFLARLCPAVRVIKDDERYYSALANAAVFDGPALDARSDEIVACIKSCGEPLSIDQIAHHLNRDIGQVDALAQISKRLASLDGLWGPAMWPAVNPTKTRDVIYAILKHNNAPMHFTAITAAVKASGLSPETLTVGAIHNRLGWDKRVVNVGQGLYALREWGYEKGTIADVIADVLRREGGPLHLDEIARRVQEKRIVKRQTIEVNLRLRTSRFRRVAPATYTLEPAGGAKHPGERQPQIRHKSASDGHR